MVQLRLQLLQLETIYGESGLNRKDEFNEIALVIYKKIFEFFLRSNREESDINVLSNMNIIAYFCLNMSNPVFLTSRMLISSGDCSQYTEMRRFA